MKSIQRLTQAALAAVVLGGMVASSHAVTVISDDFDPFQAEALQYSYDFGDTNTATSSTGIGTGAGLTGDSWQTFIDAPTGSDGFAGVGAIYQDFVVSGNTSSNPSDYLLEFDARGTGGELQLAIETWADENYGGGQTGKIETTGNNLGLSSDYAHYTLNLGDTIAFPSGSGAFDPSGGTYQLIFQYNAGGTTPYTATLDVDNLTLTMIPEPTSVCLALLAGVATCLLSARRPDRG